MTSNDIQQYVTIDILKTELGEIRYDIRSGFEKNDKEFKEIRTEIQTVKDTALVNGAKIDAYRDFTSIWFTVLTIVVALIGFLATLAPMFRDIYQNAKQNKNHDEIKEIAHKIMQDEISSEVSRAVNETIGKILGNNGATLK